jgi:hypothetical protein
MIILGFYYLQPSMKSRTPVRHTHLPMCYMSQFLLSSVSHLTCLLTTTFNRYLSLNTGLVNVLPGEQKVLLLFELTFFALELGGQIGEI